MAPGPSSPKKRFKQTLDNSMEIAYTKPLGGPPIIDAKCTLLCSFLYHCLSNSKKMLIGRFLTWAIRR